MRLIHALPSLAVLSLAASAAGDPAPAPKAEDLLGTLVVAPGAARPLPKVALVPSLSSEADDVTLQDVFRVDLDLSGEVEVLGADKAPEGLTTERATDAAALARWREVGADAVVRLVGKKDGAKVRLEVWVHTQRAGAKALLEASAAVEPGEVRAEAHRLCDRAIGALTGQDGSFASRLSFTLGSGKDRQANVIDADGHDAHTVSPAGRVALSPAFGKDGKVYYAGSEGYGAYGVYAAGPRGEGATAPLPLNVRGSVYGIAWSPDRARVAVSIGSGDAVQLHAGPDLLSLTRASSAAFALTPTFTPSGKLAYTAPGQSGQRVFVDDKPISPDGLQASSPTFCKHPDGVRAVFAVGVGKATDLVSTGESGGPLVRLTQNQGANGHPACSPDGRLVAFFSTRTSDRGPGLYVMRLDGGHARRISTLVGDSLRWDPIPAKANP